MTREQAIDVLKNRYYSGVTRSRPDDEWRLATDTALTALREQLKRSEGCEFCRPNDWERKPLGTFEIIRDDYSTEEHEIGIDDFEGGYRIATTIMFSGPSFDINYCPVCGKELFGNPEQVKEGGE